MGYLPSSTANYRIEYSYGSEVFQGNGSYRKVTVKIQISPMMFGTGDFDLDAMKCSYQPYTITILGESSGTLYTHLLTRLTSSYQTAGEWSLNVWNPSAWGGSYNRTVNVSAHLEKLIHNDGLSGAFGVSGSFNVPFTNLNEKDTITIPDLVFGNDCNISISHRTAGNKNTLTYSCGSKSGPCYVGDTGSTEFTKDASTVGYLPWDIIISLADQSQNSNTVSVTFTSVTFTSSGSQRGTSTVTKTFDIPSYSYSPPVLSSPEKTSYSNLGAYVVGKTGLKVTMPEFPSGQYGANVIGNLIFTIDDAELFNGTVTSEEEIDLGVPSAAGVGSITLTVTDGRPNTIAGTSSPVTFTYIPNPGINISSFVIYRTANTSTGLMTHAIGDIDISWGDPTQISGNTLVAEITPSQTFNQGWRTQYTKYRIATISSIDIPESDSSTVVITFTDGLGNEATSRAILPPSFAYMQVTDQQTISFGKAASSNSSRIELGLDSYFTGSILSEGHSTASRAKIVDVVQTGLSYSDTDDDIFKAILVNLCYNHPNHSNCRFIGLANAGDIVWFEVFIANTSTVDPETELPQYAMGNFERGWGSSSRVTVNDYIYSSNGSGGRITATVAFTGTASPKLNSSSTVWNYKVNGNIYELDGICTVTVDQGDSIFSSHYCLNSCASYPVTLTTLYSATVSYLTCSDISTGSVIGVGAFNPHSDCLTGVQFSAVRPSSFRSSNTYTFGVHVVGAV